MKIRTVHREFLKNIATLGFVGYIPYAPGTFGTLTGLALFLLIRPSSPVHVLIILGCTVLGVIASSVAEILLAEKDSKKIVIDEFTGFFVSVLFLPKTLGFILAAFVLFRLFDILKPLAIKKLETTLSGGLGIMADDLLAGVFANILLQIWRIII
jgi:phosphatidylglycerophosphatase A